MRISSRYVVLPRIFACAALSIGLVATGGCSGTIGDPFGGDGPGGGTGPGGTGPGGTGSSTGTGTTTGGSSGGTGGPMLCQDQTIRPGRAPLRRLTRFEYNNTVRDLFKDATNPATALPPEELGNGFGNDADSLSVSSLLAEQYYAVAEGVATRATATPAQLGQLAACAATITATSPAATEEACAKTVIETFVPKMYRRPLDPTEVDALFALEKSLRATSGATFPVAIAGALTAAMQSPDFLYRIEWGVPDSARPDLKRPSGDEMATRLSYLFWGTTPDDTLRNAAKMGELSNAQGVLTHASRMLDDARARPIVRFFFDNLLPISGLTDLERDKTLYPTFSSMIGSLMHEETQRFLEYEIFEGPGTLPGVFTAPYTFVNAQLASYYGIPNVTSTTFVKTPIDATKRVGFLTQGGIMAGTTHSNNTNLVVRGSFVQQKLLCNKIELPPPEILSKVKPPDPYSGKTGRERFDKHKSEPVCFSCHSQMDPVGYTLENFDAVGLYRTQENNVMIDPSGTLPSTGEKVANAVDLVQKLSTRIEAQTCFSLHWMDFAYGRSTGAGDECAKAQVDVAFQKSGFNVKQMLLALTQTDEFLYYPGSK